jgi:hypothetical protein
VTLLLGAAPARADAPEIVVIPTGAGPSLIPTAAVAQGLAQRLNAAATTPKKVDRARLVYLSTQLTPPTTHKAKEKQAARLLKKAQASYEVMEYDKVKTTAEEALKIYKELLKGGTAAEGYVMCMHLMAAAALLQGESKDAFRAMNDAFVFDPSPPSKKHFNPTVQELYEQVRVESPGKGTVILGSSPAALVWFNGQLQGLARGKAKIRAGLYLVRFFSPGHIPTQRWIRITANMVRNLSSVLTRDESAVEEETMHRLRAEVSAAEPGPATNQVATDTEASQVILVGAGKGCTEQRCYVFLRWAKEGTWLRRTHALYSGQAETTAATLMGVAPPKQVPVVGPVVVTPPTGTACTFDGQCSVNEKCRGGYCARVTPVTRKWWFWTLIGVGVVGVTLAVALPLAGSNQPIIEVR